MNNKKDLFKTEIKCYKNLKRWLLEEENKSLRE